MKIDTFEIKTIYFKISSEKTFPSSGYKIEAIPTIKRVSWEFGSKIEKDTNKDFVACVNFTGKINAPAKDSITTRAFAPAFFYTELETGYKNILLLDKNDIVQSVIYLDEEGNITKIDGEIDIDGFEVVR